MKELKISDDVLFMLHIKTVLSTDEYSLQDHLNEGFRIIGIQQEKDSNGLIKTYYTVGK